MAGSKFNKAFGTLGKLGGIGAAWAGSYLGTPQAQRNDNYLGRAGAAANYRFGSSDIAGLMSQIEHAPTLQNIEGTDLYNPSGKEMFASMFGAGMSSYGAMPGLTNGMKGNIGSVQLGNKTPNAPGTTPSHIDTDLMKGAETREEQFDIAESAFQDMHLGETGKDLSVKAANHGQSAASPDYSDLFPTGATYVQPNQFMVGQGFGCGGHMHGCGGHKLAGGGWADAMGELKDQMSWDWGKAANMGLGLASAGVGIGLNYLGIRNQMDQADLEAKEVNAANAYARQLMAHNLGQAVNDTKNNMFNQQALQMMAMGGDLQTHGADYPLLGDYNIIGAGGTHERNPYGGVYQGMAADGKPNLVEEDEVVWNDYVFSNRLTIPKDFAKKRKLKPGITYAEAAKDLISEAEERPNDPISQNGMADVLGALMDNQEELKQKRAAAQIKRALAAMSPEEIMNMVAALQGGQPQEQPMEQPMQMEQQPIFANGGYLDAYHKFDRGGKQNRAERIAAEKKAAMDKGLYNNAVSNLDSEWLRYIASQISGYNPANYNYTDADADIRKFIVDNYDKLGGIEGLDKAFRTGSRMPLLAENSPLRKYNYTTKDSYSMTPEQWDNFFKGMDAYQKSLKRANTDDKYAADPDFTYNGRRVGKNLPDDQNVEKDPKYIAFKKYVRDQAEKYQNGEDIDPYVMKYLQALDRNINTERGAKKLLQYNDDGTVKTVDGRIQFNDNWKKDYDERNYDSIGGIYHYYNDVPDITHTKTGERHIVRLNGQEIEITPEEMAKLKRFRHGDNYITHQTEKDAEGNDVTTHYYDYTSPEIEAEYTPDDETKKIPPLETWSRYAPLLSGLGALQGPAKDYSTNVMPQNAIYAPIGDYLAYNPVDTQRYLNAENQQAAAQLNAIMNASAGNRNMAMAQAALANQQRQQGIGQRMQAAEQINWDRLGRVGDFNRGTNMFNAQAHNQAELANLQNNHLLLNQAQRNQMMRYQADKDRDEAISASLNAFLDNLGDIGRENFAFNQANSNEALRFGVDANPWFGGYSSYRKPSVGKTVRKIVSSPAVKDLGGYLLSKPKKNRR